jgi:concanavalin A-like lectin/glucanase superfamily protein
MQTIGPYQLVQALGECPVGGVWSAVDGGNNGATVALLNTAAAHDPGWRNAFAATANSLAQSGDLQLIAGDYSGPTPWIASAAREGSVLGRVFVALGMDFKLSGSIGAAEQTGLATGSPQPISGAPSSGAPMSGAPMSGAPMSGAPSDATAIIMTSAPPYEYPGGAGPYEQPPGGGSPHTVSPSPFTVEPDGPPRRSRAPLVVMLAVALVVLVGGGAVLAFVLWPDDGEPQARPTDGPTAPVSTPPASQQGLVGKWEMDEGSGTTAGDSSGLGNDATLADGAGWTTDGHGGTPAVEYGDPPGRVLTDGPVVLSNQSFTVSAWVRISQEVSHNQYVLWQSGTDASAFVLQYRTEGLWGFSVTSIDGGEVTWYELASTSSPALTEWTHLVGVYDREQGEIRIYVNGRPEASQEATVQPSLSGLQIGSAGAGRFYGAIDSVRAYQSALTDEQVDGLYQEQQGGA